MENKYYEKKINAGYRGPVGKKFVTLSPTLMQEMMATMSSLYDAKIKAMAQRVATEAVNKLKSEIEKLKEKYENKQ